MPEAPQPTREELVRQARQRLESLQAAGVGWLPRVLPFIDQQNVFNAIATKLTAGS